MDGDGIGFGSLVEAGGKMNQHVNEAEMRRGASKRPSYQPDPPKKKGALRRFLSRLKDQQ